VGVPATAGLGGKRAVSSLTGAGGPHRESGNPGPTQGVLVRGGWGGGCTVGGRVGWGTGHRVGRMTANKGGGRTNDGGAVHSNQNGLPRKKERFKGVPPIVWRGVVENTRQLGQGGRSSQELGGGTV